MVAADTGFDEAPMTSLRWRQLGELHVDSKGRLEFPRAEAVPGIYRFLVEDNTRLVAGYIGQAKKSLASRFSLYRSRGKKPSLPLERKTTSRIARRLLDAIRADYVVRVELLNDHVVYADGRTGTLVLPTRRRGRTWNAA